MESLQHYESGQNQTGREPARSWGWIEVITGSMFSGKTEELLKRLRRANIAKQKTLLVKPSFDQRYSETEVVSHNDTRQESLCLKDAAELYEAAAKYEVIGIDEAQFFSLDLVDVCSRLAADGKRVIVAGLDQDFRGEGFGPIPQLMISAEFITKQCAICVRCGRPATKNQRLSQGQNKLELGGSETYEARCRHCYEGQEKNS